MQILTLRLCLWNDDDDLPTVHAERSAAVCTGYWEILRSYLYRWVETEQFSDYEACSLFTVYLCVYKYHAPVRHAGCNKTSVPIHLHVIGSRNRTSFRI
jgi:hypothetical protein